MKISKKLFDEKLAEYIESRLVPSIKDPLRQFLVATALGTRRISIGMFGDQMTAALGLVDAEGNVDTEALRAAMTFGMKKVENDLHVGILGLHFSQADIDKFFAFLDAIPQPPPEPTA